MRFKYLFLGLAIVGLLAPVNARAAYVGSPMNVPLDIMEENRLVIAGEGNFVSGRDLDPVAGVSSKIDESTQIGIRAEYGLAEGISFFLKTGMADWKFQTSGLMIQYDSTPYFGAGMKYVYKSESNLLLGGDIQYVMQPDAGADSVTYNSAAATSINGLDAEITDLQISVLLGYNIELTEDTTLVPYLGMTYSQFDFEMDSGNFTAPGAVSRAAQGYDGDDAMGFIAGASLQTGSNININLEARFVAESAFSIGVNYRF